MSVWFEVWGVEKGESPPPVLLFKFPVPDPSAEESVRQTAEEAATNLRDAGATLVEVCRVEE